MSRHSSRLLRSRRPRLLALGACGTLLTVSVSVFGESALAQQNGYGQTMGTTIQERNFYDYGPQQNNSSGSGSIFNATNPVQLLNQLKKSGALNEATAPDSAIDQALKDYEAKSGPSTTVKSP